MACTGRSVKYAASVMPTGKGSIMQSEVQLSTRFLTTQNAHQVGLLVSLTGVQTRRRAPINVALVLDRSGSMSGQPIAAAREAARRFASFLSTEDRLTIVTFDDVIETV